MLLPRGNGEGKIVADGKSPQLVYCACDGLPKGLLFLSLGGDATPQGAKALSDPGDEGSKPSLVILNGLYTGEDVVNDILDSLHHLDQMDYIIV